MNIFEFMRGLTEDHRMIKAIAKGDIPLKDKTLSEGYQLYVELINEDMEEKLSSEEARSFLTKELFRKAFTVKDALNLQLDFYNEFRHDAALYFRITAFISNFFNLTPIGRFNLNLDRIDGFKYKHEDLSLKTLFNGTFRTVGALSPDVLGYRFYASMPIVSEIFSGCQTPFEVLALASRVVEDAYLVHVKKINNGNVKFEWYLPQADERAKLLKRKSKVDIGVGEYFSIKDIIKSHRSLNILYHPRIAAYTVDVLSLLLELTYD